MFFFTRKSLNLLLILFISLFLLGSIKKAYADPPPPPVNPVTIIPNPFDPNEKTDPVNITTISYYLYNGALLWLRIYHNNFDGAPIKILETPSNYYTENGTTGDHSIVWDGSGTTEYGIYPYRMDDVSYVNAITTDATYYPYDVVIDPTTDPSSANLTLWVTDSGNRLLKSLNSGANWTQVTYGGTGPALGIAISNNGQIIYVVDNGATVATKKLYYSPDSGTNWYPRTLPWVTNTNSVPHDVACSTDGQYVYVVDNGTGYKKVYRSTDFGQTWNSGHQPPVGVAGLRGVAVDPNNRDIILLADTGNNRVHKAVYNVSGVPTFSIALDGIISTPYQISIDTKGYYWVSSRGNHFVQQYDSQNNLIMQINDGAGTGNYRFNSNSISLGIFSAIFDGQSYLYVASYFHKKIKIYAYDNYESDNIFENEPDDPIVTAQLDFNPPGVTTLSTATTGSNSIKVSWLAPGDDDSESGTNAWSYDLRYSKEPITTDAEFNDLSKVTKVTGVPAPSMQGTTETFTVTGLESNTEYYFALKSKDEYNLSDLSNTPPGKTGLLWKWNMVSCPKQPIPDDSNSVFGDDAGIDWMWNWIPTWSGTGDADYAGYWEQVLTIDPGKGFFLLSYDTLSPTDAPPASTDVTDSSRTFSLRAGWNLIGNPYRQKTDGAPAIVNLDSCVVKRPPDENWYTYTSKISSDCTAGWIGNAIYIWNEDDYDFFAWNVAQLEPWKGYWIFACYDLQLKICNPDIPDNPECNP